MNTPRSSFLLLALVSGVSLASFATVQAIEPPKIIQAAEKIAAPTLTPAHLDGFLEYRSIVIQNTAPDEYVPLLCPDALAMHQAPFSYTLLARFHYEREQGRDLTLHAKRQRLARTEGEGEGGGEKYAGDPRFAG